MTSSTRHDTGKRVAVFGGGIAGMTAAHELAERGFRVQVYERNDILGGKARTFAYSGTGTGGRPDLPASSGGHFFFGDMPNLGDTLRRIPLPGGGTVIDHLTGGADGINARVDAGAASVLVPLTPDAALRGIRAIGRPRQWVGAVREAIKLLPGLTSSDAAILASTSIALATSGERRQWNQLEDISYAEFLDADRLSENGVRFADIPGLIWLCGQRSVSARAYAQWLAVTICGCFGRSRYGQPRVASMLDGPETEVWFDPWARYLAGMDVRFHLGHAVTRLVVDDGMIKRATIRDATGHESFVEADHYVLALPAEKAAELIDDELIAAAPGLATIARTPLFHGGHIQIFLRHEVPDHGVFFASVDAPWFVGGEVLSKNWRLDLTDYGDGTVRECISVYLSDRAWNSLPGMVFGKPAKECTRTELFEEVVAQLRHYVHDGVRIFATEAIHSIQLGSVHGTDNDGDRIWVNEPLYSIEAGASRERPDTVTQIPNLFLAGTYTNHFAVGDQMCSANESGRHAAAGVLNASGVIAPPVRIDTWSPPAWLRLLWTLDNKRFARGLPNLFDTRRRRPWSAPAEPSNRITGSAA